jgi:hypothetical protein
MTLAIEVILPSSDAAERRGEAVAAAVARAHLRADNGGAAGAVD